MKMEVRTGQWPGDVDRKARPIVLLGQMKGGLALCARTTTHVTRTGNFLPGALVLSLASPAVKTSGLDRDTALMLDIVEVLPVIRLGKPIGFLDLSKDIQLAKVFEAMARHARVNQLRAAA